MKKLLAVVLVVVLVIAAFLIGNKTNIKNNNELINVTEENSEIISNIPTQEKQEESTTKIENQKLSRNDFYLYKEDWGSNGFYIYREDGQILNVGDEATFTYDYRGLIETASDDYFGSGYFQYDFVDGCYVGTAYFDGKDVSLRYTYDENYRLILREEISGSDISSYEIIYNIDGTVFRTIEIDWLKTVKTYNENGILEEEIVYSNDNELIESIEYDNEGKVCSHKYFENGEVYKYSEFKKDGDKYIEYIYDTTLPDSHYETYGLPIGSYDKYVEREYDDYGNLVCAKYCFATGFTDNTVYYEYKLKEK